MASISSSSSSPSWNPSSTSSGMSGPSSSGVDGANSAGRTPIAGDEGAEDAVASGFGGDVDVSVNSHGGGESSGVGARISHCFPEEAFSSRNAHMAVNCDCADRS